jgi:hypothetical protein
VKKWIQTALRKRSESQAADACEHGLLARPDFQFGDAGFQFRRRESAVVDVRISAPKLQNATVGVVMFQRKKIAIQTRSYLFETFSLVLERHVLVVDDVLEQLTHGLAGFIFALLLETFGRHLLTVGQRYGVVRIKTDLMRHPQRAEGGNEKNEKEGNEDRGQERKKKNENKKNRKLKHRYKPNINTKTLSFTLKNDNFSQNPIS